MHLHLFSADFVFFFPDKALGFPLYALKNSPLVAEMHISRHVFHFFCMKLLAPANCILLNFTDFFKFLILACHAAVKVGKHFSRLCNVFPCSS